MSNAKKFPMITSPLAVFKYPKLDKPDYGTKDYPNPEGAYKVNLVMKADDPVTKAFIAKMMPLYNEAMAEAEAKFAELKIDVRKKLKQVTQNDLFTTLYDKETEQPTGYIEFKIKMAASGVFNAGKADERAWSAKPSVFDAKGKPMRDVPEIWGGSEGKVSFEARPYFINGTAAAGLSLKMKAVQLITLRQGGERSADEFGFGEEDGFEYNSEAASNGFQDETGGDMGGSEDNGSQEAQDF